MKTIYLVTLTLLLSDISFTQSLGEPSMILDYEVNEEGSVLNDYALTGDFDNDGLTDFLSIKKPEIRFNKNLGFGDFATPVWAANPYAGGAPSSNLKDHHAMDINNDGNLDVVVLSSSQDFILLGNGDGTFGAAYDPFNESELLEFYDVNLDGEQDVIFSAPNTDGVPEYWAFMNNADGTFQPAVLTNLPIVLPTHDLDGDGDLDAFLITGTELLWLEMQADSIFTNHHIDSIADSWPLNFTKKLPADLDQDGDVDLVISVMIGSELGIWIYENQETQFTRHDYPLEFINDLEYLFFGGAQAVLVDADNNGFQDIHFVTSVNDEITPALYLNSGDLSQLTIQEISGPFPFNALNEWLDVDGDSDLDLLSAGGTTSLGGYGEPRGTVVWYSNELVNQGCGDIEACNFNANATPNSEYCFYESGCPYENSTNYNANARCISCDYIVGCMFEGALNYNPDAQIVYFSDCEYAQGCTSQCSSNYDPEAVLDDGTCDNEFVTLGCTYDHAINFNTVLDTCAWDNQTCLFDVTVHVFYDENEDGLLDTNEVMLPFQTVVVGDSILTLITDDFGQASTVLPDSMFSFYLSPSEEFPVVTTSQSVIQSTTETDVYFGVSNEFGEFNLEVSLYSTADGYPCDDEVSHLMFVKNLGHGMVNGKIELAYDSLFQDFIEVDSISLIQGNTLTLEFDSLMPWQHELIKVGLRTPTVEFIGEVLVSEISVQSFIDEDSLVAQATEMLSQPLTCAYDPNDKNGYPTGYTDEHFIENGQKIEYVVRFQNTGNALATDIHILDELSEYLDLSTFKVLNSSHSVQAELNMETREVDFFFENIMLPDSVNNEPESHGLVVFEITPHADLGVQTEINNTARIFFDNNPPIITNTTSHRIWGCELMTFSAGETTIDACTGEEIHFMPETQYVEDYHWELFGEELITEDLTMLIQGEKNQEIIAEFSNPFCTEQVVYTLNVIGELPVAPVIEQDQFGLVTEQNSEYTYQWFVDGEPIESAHQFFLNPTNVSGVYQVQVTNAEGCSTLSEGLEVDTSIYESQFSQFSIFPNPTRGNVHLEFEIGEISAVEILSQTGKRVIELANLEGLSQLEIPEEKLSEGVYFIQVRNRLHQFRTFKLVVI